MNAEREAKLPQWARAEIDRLRRDVAEANEKIANVIGKEPTAIEVDPYRRYDDKSARRFLPADAMIRVAVPHGHIDLQLRDGWLEAIGMAEGEGQFCVVPQSGNVVRLDIAKVGE